MNISQGNFKRGPWIHSEADRTIHHEKNEYYIAVDEMVSSAKVLDAIMQISAKTWCSASDCKDLIEVIRIVVDPQATLCSWGRERPTMLERSEAAIGQTWTAEMHAALVAHLAAVDKLAQDVIRLRDAERDPIRGRDLEERS